MEMNYNKEITEKIIRAFYSVYNTLGYGFLESVYEKAMMLELKELGLKVQRQQPVEVYYKEKKVGLYFSDILVEECVVVELKAAEVIAVAHECQLINYLKATQIELGLLLNFGPKAEFKRKYFSNTNKSLSLQKKSV